MTDPTPEIRKEPETGAEPPKPRPRRKPSRLRKAYLWTRNKARESGGLLFLLALMAAGALGLYQFDTLQEESQSCDETCRFTFKDDRPKSLEEQENFWTCRNICQTEGREEARNFVFDLLKKKPEAQEKPEASTEASAEGGGPENQQQESSKTPKEPKVAASGWSSIAAWFSGAWETIGTVAGNTWSFVTGRTMPEQLLALLTTLSLIAVLVGIGGAILLLVLRFFRLNSLVKVVQGIQGDTLKLLLAGSALAATTAGAGFFAGKVTDPPDLAALSKEASALQIKLAEIDRQAEALLPRLDEARRRITDDLSVTNGQLSEQIRELQTSVDSIKAQIESGPGITSQIERTLQDVQQIKGELQRFRAGFEELKRRNTDLALMVIASQKSSNGPGGISKEALLQLEEEIGNLSTSVKEHRQLIATLETKMGTFTDRDETLKKLLVDWNKQLANNQLELQKMRKTLGSL